MEEKEFKKLVKDLLWNIAKQREKVEGTLRVMIDNLYPDYTEDEKYEMRKKILKNIG